MNSFDYSILSFCCRHADRHPWFNHLVAFVSSANTLTAGPIVAICWWAWFKDGQETTDRNIEVRRHLVSIMLLCTAGVLIARLLTKLLPFRIRPMADPTNGLHFAQKIWGLQHWSSFPSDHAILFFTLAVGILSISPTLGWLALADTFFLICLPRVYLGIHYPTDILVGALLGISAGLVANNQSVWSYLSKWPMQWLHRHPGLFYAAFFVLTYETAAIFWDVRQLGNELLKVLLLKNAISPQE